VRTIRDEASEWPRRLTEALGELEAGRVQALFVTRWDRLGPDKFLIHGLRRHAVEFGWSLEILDDLLDDAEDGVSRNLRSQRTMEGLAEARALGVRLGRPRRCDDHVLWATVEENMKGVRQVDIAERFNALGIPTPGGTEFVKVGETRGC